MPKISEKIVDLRALKDKVYKMTTMLGELGHRLDKIDEKFPERAKGYGVPLRYVAEFDRASDAIANTLNKALPELEQQLSERAELYNLQDTEMLMRLLDKFFSNIEKDIRVEGGAIAGVLDELSQTGHDGNNFFNHILETGSTGPGKVDWTKWFREQGVLDSKPKTLALFRYLSKSNWHILDLKESTTVTPPPARVSFATKTPKVNIGKSEKTGDPVFLDAPNLTPDDIKEIEEDIRRLLFQFDHANDPQRSIWPMMQKRYGEISSFFSDDLYDRGYAEISHMRGLRTKTINRLVDGGVHFAHQLLDRHGNHPSKYKLFKQPIHLIRGIGKRVILELQYALAKFGVGRHGFDLFTTQFSNDRDPDVIRPREELLSECLITAGVEHLLNSFRSTGQRKANAFSTGAVPQPSLRDLVLPDYSMEKCYEKFGEEPVFFRHLPRMTNEAFRMTWRMGFNEEVPRTFRPMGFEGIGDSVDMLTVFGKLESEPITNVMLPRARKLILAEYFGWKSVLGINADGRTWYDDTFGATPWIKVNGNAVPVNRLLDLKRPDPKWYEPEPY